MATMVETADRASDLDEAVKAAALGAFMNQGQICMSTERIIVVDSVADACAAKFREKVSGMKAGDPRSGNTPLGAVVDRKTIDWVGELIEDATAKGATLLAGETAPAEGVPMAATVIDGVTNDMKLYRTRCAASAR
jgi:acyl-CoA reductase-like NAD-dependent aldehyde dehydrogenase